MFVGQNEVAGFAFLAFNGDSEKLDAQDLRFIGTGAGDIHHLARDKIIHDTLQNG